MRKLPEPCGEHFLFCIWLNRAKKMNKGVAAMQFRIFSFNLTAGSMVLVKRSPSLSDYKGPLSSKVFKEEQFHLGGSGSPLLFFKEEPHSFEIQIEVPGLVNKNYNVDIETDGSMTISSEILKTEEGEGPAEGKLNVSIRKQVAGNPADNGHLHR